MTVLIVGPDPTSATSSGGHVADVEALLQELHHMGVDASVLADPRIHFGGGAVGRLTRGLGRIWAAVRAASGRPDLVILLAGPPASFLEKAMMAGVFRGCGVPTVLCPRSGHVATAVREGSGLVRMTLRAAARLPAALAAQTEAWRKFYVDELGVETRRACVVENWIVTDELQSLAVENRACNPSRVLFAAALHPDKGVEDIIEMIPLLAPMLRRIDARFTIVGDGPAAGAVARLCDRYAPWVVWRRSVPRPEFLRLLASQHVLVAPSRVEGFPNLLVEAACLGVAIVASPAGGVGEVFTSDELGVLVAPGRPAELARVVTVLLEDVERRDRMMRAAQEHVNVRYSAGRNVPRLLEAGVPGGVRRSYAGK